MSHAVPFRASGLILVHNHPDGLPAPSRQYLELNMKIEALANELDVYLLDPSRQIQLYQKKHRAGARGAWTR
jgi:DNA repair protein RadC